MAYTMKPLVCDPTRIKGMSEKLLVSQYQNNSRGPHGCGSKKLLWPTRAVSIYPQLQNGQPMAEVMLLQGTSFKKVMEKLD
jgi:hypothetical protein